MIPVKKFLLILLVILAGIVILYPYHNFQAYFSQGDNGRDFYAFKKTLEGGQPYRDYWWVYGPLMPYYYALFYKMFGISIQTVLLGKIVLWVLSGLFVYLALAAILPASFAFLASVWYWAFNPTFTYTYNHIGGVCCTLLIIYLTFLYIKKPRTILILLNFVFLFVLCLIKINIGCAGLLAFAISLYIIDKISKNPLAVKNRKTGLCVLVAIPLLAAFIHWLFVRGLTVAEIRQCIIYLPEDRPIHASILTTGQTLWGIMIHHVSSTLPNFLFSMLVLLCILNYIHMQRTKKMKGQEARQTSLSLAVLLIFSGFYSHEFLLSGIPYRLYWISFFLMMFNMILICKTIRFLPKFYKSLFLVIFLFMASLFIYDKRQLIKTYKIPAQRLLFKTADVYMANPCDWIMTVKLTTSYLTEHLDKNELFLALPYDPIYYFLTNKESPTRQLIFFDHINIPKEQEQEIIRELEKKNVHYIVLSSRLRSPAPGIGTFGETYCPVLAKYIDENFKVVAQFGNWQEPPIKAWEHHGTRILKRVNN
ncbi:MAG: hypothetical protein ABIJ41_08275 [Candidatus Omnitrophota bacterium]